MDNEAITEVSEEITTDDEAVTEDKGLDAALEAANAKAEMLEAKLLCYESGVSGGYADDVIALAKSYGGDVKSAIGEVIAKYPFFCSADAPKPAEKEKLTTGVRFSSEQKSSCGGVEAAFRRSNPNIRF